MFWLIAFGCLAAALFYVLIVRPILKTQPLLAPAFKAEATLWQMAQAKLVGFRTKLTARLIGLASVLVALHDLALPYVTGQDWSPIMARIPQEAIPFLLMGLTWLFDYLRKITENPPHVIIQKDADGTPQVVAIEKAVQ
jgi:hypothetical protein